MKVTILYDNTLIRKDLQSDWGFAALVEAEGAPRILFDTGGNGAILLSNMAKLGIDPASIDEVFLSHTHFDHIGGLSEFLNVNDKVKIYVPPSIRGIKAAQVVEITAPTCIHDNVFSTGELDGIEQGMGVITGKGIVLVVGCSHPDMEHILAAAREFGDIYGIIGGLHGFSEYKLFEDLQLICPTHCTQHIQELEQIYPDSYVEGGAGQVIEVS